MSVSYAPFLGVLIAASVISCDTGAGPAEYAAAEARAGLGSTSVGPVRVRADDGAVRLTWSTGYQRSLELRAEPPPPPPRVAAVRVLMSETGPDDGFRVVAVRDSSPGDTLHIDGLANDRNVYFRVAVHDSDGVMFGISSVVMATPGRPLDVLLSAPAPQSDDPLWMSNVSWSPDSRSIALVRKYGDGVMGDVVVFDTHAQTFRPVTAFTHDDYRLLSADWSPDGARIAFTYSHSARAGSIDYRVWVVAAETGVGMPITSGRIDGYASWVDERNLVFAKGTYEAPNVPELYAASLDAAVSERALTSGRAWSKHQPAYSATARLIAFSGDDADHGRAIYTLDLAGGEARRVTHNAPKFYGDIQPAWSPDGSTIFFASNRTGHYEIWRTGPAGTLAQVSRGFDDTVRFHPRVSPDGTRLAYLERRGKEPFRLVIASLVR